MCFSLLPGELLAVYSEMIDLPIHQIDWQQILKFLLVREHDANLDALVRLA